MRVFFTEKARAPKGRFMFEELTPVDLIHDRLIASIRVEKLFGLYTYTLPREGHLQSANILYGDNGVGKTSILMLVFHLLSPAPNKNHRGTLYETEFDHIEVRLYSGVTVSATKESHKVYGKTLIMNITKENRTLATWTYYGHSRSTQRKLEFEHFLVHDTDFIIRGGLPSIKVKKSSKEKVNEGEEVFLSTLATYSPVTFKLNAERRLDSDAVPDPSDEVELRRILRGDESKRINDLAIRAREIALSQALSNTARWISRKHIRGANQGATNVNSIYLNVLNGMFPLFRCTRMLMAGGADTPSSWR
jgi:hypothetical protein